jgi:SAM-dependent methyltransferase
MTRSNSDSNVIRNRVIELFRNECLQVNELSRVAIVGGSLGDHEVAVIKEKFPLASFEIYGIEEGQIFLDLNSPPDLEGDFDLVLCTNVIEHVYNHENFAKNLLSLLNPKGTLWCCFPYSDMYHGSPDYYSAGFDPDYVVKLFARNGAKSANNGIIGSRRSYLFTHLLKDWPSEFRYNHPFLGHIIWALGLRSNPRPSARNLSLRRLIICFYLSFASKEFTNNPNNGCSAWVKLGKN